MLSCTLERHHSLIGCFTGNKGEFMLELALLLISGLFVLGMGMCLEVRLENETSWYVEHDNDK